MNIFLNTNNPNNTNNFCSHESLNTNEYFLNTNNPNNTNNFAVASFYKKIRLIRLIRVQKQ